MIDGIYQSVMVFWIPYLLFNGSSFISVNGLNVEDRVRLGCYIAHPAVLTINLYILINTYRWDWIMLLVIALSDLFIFFWTGIYTTTTGSGVFYKAAPQVYGEATFWAVFFLTPVICIFPRFAIKSIQKVYFPYDVDIIREQDRQGKFDRLTKADPEAAGAISTKGRTPSGSSETSRKGKHAISASVDDDRRPIYPPSLATNTTHNVRSQNGSDGTNYTGHRVSLEMPPPLRPSMDRSRPSFDRMRASMDRVRPSFEASHDFTSAARLARIESSQSTGHSRFPRLRGLSLTKSSQI
jgi:phospholipid-translocating ATPase